MSANPANERSGQLWSVASPALAISASIALVFVPFRSAGFSGVGTGQQTYVVATPRHTLLDVWGAGAVVFILWPILITALAVILSRRGNPRRLRGLSVLLLLPVLPIGYFVVGAFYLPSAIAMVIAWLRARRPGELTHGLR